MWHPWQSSPGSFPVLQCCEPGLSLLLQPSQGGWFGSLGMDPGQGSSSARGAAAAFQEPSRAWQPCLCPGHIPPVPLLVLLLFLCPFSGHRWTPGSHHSKSLTWCKKSRCHLPMGSPLLCNPQGAAGKGRDGVALPLAHPVLCPLLWKAAGCGARLSQPPPPALGSQGVTHLVWSMRRTKGFEGFCSFL